MPTKEVLLAARNYLSEEPEDDKRAECEQLLEASQRGDSSASLELESRFSQNLSFGTAGMRGRMEAGTARLNCVTVAKAAFAIGSWLKTRDLPVVVGYDARLNSDIFAREVSSVLQGMGFQVLGFLDYVATPICAFAVTDLQAQAGIMITASHNPPQDNGIKVYNGLGEQICDDDARDIESQLKPAPSYSQLLRRDDLSATIDSEDLISRYLARVVQTRIQPKQNRERLKVVYTPMHGVGYRFIERALPLYDFVDLEVVAAQKEGDGRFPTLPFPNPEEAGALDRAIAQAQKCNADLIVANDPDADRLAVALRRPGSDEYQMVSGNELGALLGCDVLENMQSDKKKLVVTTLVSSRLLSAMAKKTGASYAESLTGFSRVAEIAKKREMSEGECFVYAFEEALGYCYGEVVRDKDGINAALHLLDRAALLKARGKTLWDELDRISLSYGLFRSAQWSLRFSGPNQDEKRNLLMEEVRTLKAGESFFGEQKINNVHDLLTENYQNFCKANIYIIVLDDRTRIVVRPSGTEPKVKFYAEKHVSVDSERLSKNRIELDAKLESIKKTVFAAFAHLH